jgi:hypothetical protein
LMTSSLQRRDAVQGQPFLGAQERQLEGLQQPQQPWR